VSLLGHSFPGRVRRLGLRAVALLWVVGGGAACGGLSAAGGGGPNPGAAWGGTSAVQPAPPLGPPHGTLLLAGGGRLGPEIWERFVLLAGGDTARILVIPTAGTEEEFPDDWSGFAALREAGARDLRILHTRNREEADSEALAIQVREATGVWIPGGRQWRLVDAYLNTRVHEELHALLGRGGAVGGTSAGASIQADFLVRGDPSSNQILVAPDYLEGFGFLVGAAVDQHLLTRARENDLWEILSARPDLLGIGIDEGTAILVRGDEAEVLGSSQVLLYHPSDPLRRPRILMAGDRLDLGDWRRTLVGFTGIQETHPGGGR
jgi:cyanophycinase